MNRRLFNESLLASLTLPAGEREDRITSYNVCYTKLLRARGLPVPEKVPLDLVPDAKLPEKQLCRCCGAGARVPHADPFARKLFRAFDPGPRPDDKLGGSPVEVGHGQHIFILLVIAFHLSVSGMRDIPGIGDREVGLSGVDETDVFDGPARGAGQYVDLVLFRKRGNGASYNFV